MVVLSENDYLEVKLNSLIADYDSETISNLYQPIIGYASLAVYFTLISEAKNQSITSVISHNQLLTIRSEGHAGVVPAKAEGI